RRRVAGQEETEEARKAEEERAAARRQAEEARRAEEERAAAQAIGQENGYQTAFYREPQAAYSRKGKPGGRGIKIAGAAVAAVILAGAVFYVVKAQRYRHTYYPNTVINGLEAEGMTAEQMKEQIASALNGYEIRLIQRYDGELVITGEEIGLHTVFDGSLEALMEKQNPYLWGFSYFKHQDSSVAATIAYDEEKFKTCLDQLAIFDPSYVKPYQEAYLSEYISGQGYEIVPEEPGTAVNREIFSNALTEAVLALKPELSLEETGCYERAPAAEPDEALVQLRDQMNRYAKMTVTYTFGSKQEILDGDEIHQWISFDENHLVSVDEAMVSEYVSGLAKKYNTAYSKRKFKTSYGPEVEVTGFYGWQINQKAETEALAAIIASGESQAREPEYTQKGASYEGNDYGNTYAEVNLTAQHMFLYKDGEKILESDFVSGNVSRGYTTPPGIFSITYKQRDAVLKGEGYASPVKFWMPFNRGIGFHDASWRNTFGGSIYKTNGSHGCVNMPYSAAKTLFENVYAGMPVICYNLDGTGSTKSTAASGSGGTAAKPAQTQPAVQPSETPSAVQPSETPSAVQPPETVPAEVPDGTAPAVQPDENAPAAGPSQTDQTAAGPGSSTPAADPAGPGAQPSSDQGMEYGPGGQSQGTQIPSADTPSQAPAVPSPLPAETPAAAPGGGIQAPTADYSAGPGAVVAPGSTAGPGGI
ncbi:MAG: L,D-transpeptidase family protein, partial [Lachnospiraceae bacterium]|nr:L,D-transpeptidase family protein [Lachnospiraceae bacterium]